MNAERLYALMRAGGATADEALRRVKYLNPKRLRNKAAKEFEGMAEVRMWTELFTLSDKPEEVKRELVAYCVQDSRDEDLPPSARHKARELLVRILGFDKQTVAVSADDVFRDFLLTGARRKS